MGKLGVGGTEKGREKQSINFQTVEGCYQNRSSYVRMYLGESSLFFLSIAASRALVQPVDRFLNVRFPFVLFKMWHLERREKPAVFWWALPCQNKAGRGKRRARPGPDRCRLLTRSVMSCRGHFIKIFSVLCKVCIQNTT